MEMQLMSSKYEKIPFSYFMVDRKLNILSVSKKTFSEFDEVQNFIEIVGIGSKKKAASFILDTPSISKVELNMKTKNKPLCLFDIYIQYENKETIHIFCINKEESLEPVYQAMKNLELDLMKANMSLLEKNTQLEKSLKEMKELAVQNHHLRSFKEIAASISMDLSNPLTSIKGFFNQVKPHLVDPGEKKLNFDGLNRANYDLYEYLFDERPPIMSKRKIMLSQLLDEAAMIVKKEADDFGCEVHYQANLKNPVLFVDNRKITQVILNIVRNAMESFMEKEECEGKVQIFTTLKSNSIEIVIEDNGCGMNQEVLEKLFIPFSSTKEKGKGLGLAVSMEILKNHEGEIKIDSKHGEGTRVTLVLPYVEIY
ncbi:GHKL domain-containing protein [Bacillus sp. FJAT-42376]|uniref:ATP-binding protein n=1 Tax=Bacillus sp. FJAT-42376 TaxID=2014076 RepID=UPI000F502F58|nr:ATP-binding protein [Bacillus sp. FJAT-42376]AZB41988.1 GHKL domain-containing protein [Bacillus sp. FJAT-42376]